MIEGGDVMHIRRLIEERFGLACADWQTERLAGAMGRVRASAAQRAPRSDPSPAELLALASELTVHETYFFRDLNQIEAFVAVALPERARLGAPGRTIRILSVGCASGEEAYSLALAIGERAPEVASRVVIHGIDISSAAIARARHGVYSPWSLRTTPVQVRERCFLPTDADFRLKEEHRSQVIFEQRNMFQDDPAFWAPASFDIIFCRNVTIYFSERATRAAIARFAAALAPGGLLFLGHTETLRGLSAEFEPLHAHGGFYHRRRTPSEAPSPLPASPLPAAPAVDTPWTEAIRQASERVAEITRRPVRAAPAAETAAPSASEPLRSLIAAERFEQGLALLRTMPKEVCAAPDVQLLEAVMLSGLGRIDEVERVCRKLLEESDVNAGAHYLLGICCEHGEHVQSRPRAVRHYRDAVRSDPSFAMAYVRIGLLARSAGDPTSARVELRQALTRLAGASTDHILLFGGGFSREVLRALCSADLDAPGGER